MSKMPTPELELLFQGLLQDYLQRCDGKHVDKADLARDFFSMGATCKISLRQLAALELRAAAALARQFGVPVPDSDT